MSRQYTIEYVYIHGMYIIIDIFDKKCFLILTSYLLVLAYRYSLLLLGPHALLAHGQRVLIGKIMHNILPKQQFLA